MDEEDELSRSDPVTISVESEAAAESSSEFAVLKPVSYEIEGVANVQDVTNEQVDAVSNEQINNDPTQQVDNALNKPIDIITNKLICNSLNDQEQSVKNEEIINLPTEQNETDTMERVAITAEEDKTVIMKQVAVPTDEDGTVAMKHIAVTAEEDKTVIMKHVAIPTEEDGTVAMKHVAVTAEEDETVIMKHIAVPTEEDGTVAMKHVAVTAEEDETVIMKHIAVPTEEDGTVAIKHVAITAEKDETITKEHVDVTAEGDETVTIKHEVVDIRINANLNDSMEIVNDTSQIDQLGETISTDTPQQSSFRTSCNKTIIVDEETNISVHETKRKRRYQRKVYGNDDPSGTPGESRYGRVRKPKLANDFVSVDRKSFAVLNSSSYKHVFVEGEEPTPPKIAKVTHRVKVPGRGRGRPRKTVLNVDNVTEIVSKVVDSTEPKTDVDEVHSVDESSINSINSGTIKTYSKLNEKITVSTPEASQDKQEDSEKTTPLPQINYPELDWRVGDIAWARIGCYPYWPSIVTLEYGSSTYVKPVGKRGRLAVHVQFFGDRGRRSWVLTSSLIKYESKEQFMELKRQYKKDKFRFKNFNVFRMKDLWDKSIGEADTILKLPHEERIQHYQTMYPVSEEIYVAELANASKAKSSIRRLQKTMKHRRRGRRRLIDGSELGNVQKLKRFMPLADETNKNVEASTDSPSSITLDDSSKPLKKRKRKPMDEHIKKRRAFERRLNKMLEEAKHIQPKNSDRQGKNSAKLQKIKNARFNALLKSGENASSAVKTNKNLLPSSSNLSNLSEEKRSALSVYDFESDEETDVFMSYNSRFSSQVLPRIEKRMETTENDDMTEPKAKEGSAIVLEAKSRLESQSDIVEINVVAVKNDTEEIRPTEVKRRGRGRPKGSKNLTPSMRFQQKLAQRRRPKQVGQVAGMRRRKGASLFVRRKQPAGSIKSESNRAKLGDEMEEPPVKLLCGLEDLQKINKLISIEDEQSSDEDEYKSTEDEKRRSLSPDKTPSTRVKKGSSLFAGMKNERVCFVCEKAGDTVRCRGPCGGTYHIECERKLYVNDVMQEVVQKPRRGRKPRKSILAAKDDEIKAESTTEDRNDESEENKTTEEGQENAAEIAEEIDEPITKKADESTAVDSMENIPGVQIDNVERITPVMKTVDVLSEEKDPEAMDVDENAENVIKNDAEESNVIAEELHSEESTEKEKNTAEVDNEVVESKEKIKKAGDDCAQIEAEETKEEIASYNMIVESDANSSNVEFRCKKCTDNELYPCFTCGLMTQQKTGETEKYSCYLQYCGRVYHKECLKEWPQATWVHNSLIKQIRNGSASTAKEMLMCPQHYCHTCISEDPVSHKNKESKERLVRCIRCPTAYHKRVHCIPAGTEILSLTQIICPRHYEPPPGAGHCNTNWCCICCIGGSLICCEDCPMAFHAECLNLPPEEYEGRYICEDCQNGRFLLYGEVAWVKLGHYRWWPAQILYPSQVPDNIRNISHRRGEFAVRFFGSNNYNWISRGRSFVYQDGDSGKNNCGRKSVDMVFVKALEEAKEAYRLLRIAKEARDKEHRAGLKPPKYGRISANKPIGSVRIVELNTSNITACECDPKSERPCAPDSDCLNRMLLVECNPAVCEAGERCLNQAFEKRVYPPLMPFKTEKRGWGLKALVDLKKGDFIIEYVGEMITEEEYQRRLNIMHQNQEVNYYFLTIDKDRMLDAGPKGNVSRFMNHSCDPNCETQKWTVNGDTRIGLFALKEIPANTELTFNYNLVSQGNEMKPCYCGSDKCAGFIGLRPTKQNGSVINNDDETRKKSCEDNRKKSIENGNGDQRKVPGRKRGRPRLESKPSISVSNLDDSCSKAIDNEQKATPGEPPKKRKRFRKPSIIRNAMASTNQDENNPDLLNENVESIIDTIPVADLPPKKRECAGKLSETPIVNDNNNTANLTEEKDDLIEEKNDKKSVPVVEMQPSIKRGRGRPKKKTNNSESKTKAGRRRIRNIVLMKKHRVATIDGKEKSLANGDKPKKLITVAKKKKAEIEKTETKSEQEKQESLFRMMKKRIDNKFIEMSSIDGLEEACFVCGKAEGGDLLFCDYIQCPKGYHLTCLNKTTAPKGRWLCPWHQCTVCRTLGKVKQCKRCTNSYCDQHAKDRIFDADGGYVCEKHVSNVEKTTKNLCNQELQDAEVSSSNKNEKESGRIGREPKPSLNNVAMKDNIKQKLTSNPKERKKPSLPKKTISNKKQKQISTKESGKKSVSMVKRVLNERRSETLDVVKPKMKKKLIQSFKSSKKKIGTSLSTKKTDSIVIKKVKKKSNTFVKDKVIRFVSNENKTLIRKKKKKLMANKMSKSNGTIATAVGTDSNKWKPAKVEKEKPTDKETKIEDVTMEYTEESEIIDSDTFIEEYHPEDFPPADHAEGNPVETAVVEETNRKTESDCSFVSCESATEDFKGKEQSDKDDQVASDDEIVNLEVEEVDSDDSSR